MHTYVFMQRWFPYCQVPSSLSPEEEGRDFSGNGPLSPVLKGGRGSWELLLATCRSARSFLSYRDRDSTSVSGLWVGGGAGRLPSWRACPCGLRLLRRGGSRLPLSGANYTQAASSPLHLNQSNKLIQTDTAMTPRFILHI